jgi:hypothetical protein
MGRNNWNREEKDRQDTYKEFIDWSDSGGKKRTGSESRGDYDSEFWKEVIR